MYLLLISLSYLNGSWWLQRLISLLRMEKFSFKNEKFNSLMIYLVDKQQRTQHDSDKQIRGANAGINDLESCSC